MRSKRMMDAVLLLLSALSLGVLVGAEKEEGKAETPQPVVKNMEFERGFESGGTWIKMVGDHFSKDMKVTFGGDAAELKFYNEQKIYVVTPAHKPGRVDVVIKNEGAAPLVLEKAYEYLPTLQLKLKGVKEGDVLATNKGFEISGEVSGGGGPPYELEFTINGKDGSQKTLSLKNGDFKTELELKEGFNYVFVLARDRYEYLTWTNFHVMKDTIPPEPPGGARPRTGAAQPGEGTKRQPDSTSTEKGTRREVELAGLGTFVLPEGSAQMGVRGPANEQFQLIFGAPGDGDEPAYVVMIPKAQPGKAQLAATKQSIANMIQNPELRRKTGVTGTITYECVTIEGHPALVKQERFGKDGRRRTFSVCLEDGVFTFVTLEQPGFSIRLSKEKEKFVFLVEQQEKKEQGEKKPEDKPASAKHDEAKGSK